jgi:BirA family transcriptional regulator, biotin operon repressor / biotin---[acetyl-CoA-carboxylase] ligase
LIFSEVVGVGLDLRGVSPLNLEALQRNLQTQYFGVGNHLLYLSSIESTNSLAMQLAYERPEEGLVILTDSQTAGKGRRGRRWIDVPGCNVLMSVLFRPLFPPSMLVMMTSLAVVDAIADICQVVATIKWPNDVLIEDRKVAGILIETSHDSNGHMFAVAGIGVNVNGTIEELEKHSSMQVPLTTIATTLESACGHKVSREVFIARLLQYLEESYFALQQENTDRSDVKIVDTEPFTRLIRERWRSQLATLGRTVVVQQENSVISGIAEDVDESGELLLRRHSGELVRITWGDIEYPAR